MKNIHVLPTDQPSSGLSHSLHPQSRFWIDTITGKLVLDKEPNTLHMHLYITSDEKIIEGDWYLWQAYGGEYFKEKCEYLLYEGKKTKHLNCNKKTQFKVILSTDQNLIPDGVQAIDDEFLEYFCSVNGEINYVNVEDYGNLYNFRYLILIPKPKQDHFQEMNDFMIKETLEAAAERLTENVYQNDTWEKGRLKRQGYYQGIIEGAKYQKQNSYSESELRELIIKALTHNDDKLCGSLVTVQKEIRTANFNVWFEENKKK